MRRALKKLVQFGFLARAFNTICLLISLNNSDNNIKSIEDYAAAIAIIRNLTTAIKPKRRITLVK
jgi:hypothetical protein